MTEPGSVGGPRAAAAGCDATPTVCPPAHTVVCALSASRSAKDASHAEQANLRCATAATVSLPAVRYAHTFALCARSSSAAANVAPHDEQVNETAGLLLMRTRRTGPTPAESPGGGRGRAGKTAGRAPPSCHTHESAALGPRASSARPCQQLLSLHGDGLTSFPMPPLGHPRRATPHRRTCPGMRWWRCRPARRRSCRARTCPLESTP